MARRVITAREQYDLAEPFLRTAEPVDYDKIYPQDPAPVTPAPASPPAPVDPGHFHPDFKQWMDDRDSTNGGYEGSAWEDYHNGPQDANWWHDQFASYPGNQDKKPIAHPDFVNWMNNMSVDFPSSWKDYHADDNTPGDYHKLYEEENTALPPGYVIGGPKNKNTPLVGLLKGYSDGDLNYGQATKAINQWIEHNQDISKNMINPEGIGVLKDLIGDTGLYGDFVDLLDKKNHAQLTGDHQYDPHTGKKVLDKGTDEDLDVIEDLLKPVQQFNNPFSALADQGQDKTPSFEELKGSGVGDYWAKKISEYTPEEYSKIVKNWQEMGELDPTSVAAKVLKWHNSQSAAPEQPGFSGAVLAKDLGPLFGMDPEKVKIDGWPVKDMTAEQAKAGLQKLISIHGDGSTNQEKKTIEGLKQLHDLHFGDDDQKSGAPPLADWEKELLGIHNIPDWAMDGATVKPELLEYLKGKGLSTLAPAELFNPNNPEHVQSLNEISPESWGYLQKNFAQDTASGITADIIKKYYPDHGDDTVKNWVGNGNPETQKDKVLKHLKKVTDPNSGMYNMNAAAKWSKIYEDSFGSPPQIPKSVAQNAAEAFAPAGFKLKNQDQFFQDHAPEGSGPQQSSGIDYTEQVDPQKPWAATGPGGVGHSQGFKQWLQDQGMGNNPSKLYLNDKEGYDAAIKAYTQAYNQGKAGQGGGGLTADLIKEHIDQISDHTVDTWVNADDPQGKLKNHIENMQKQVDNGSAPSASYIQNLGAWKAIYEKAFGSPAQGAKSPALNSLLNGAPTQGLTNLLNFNDEDEGVVPLDGVKDTPTFQKWFNKNYPNWSGPSDADPWDISSEYHNPFTHQTPHWLEDTPYSDQALDELSDWQDSVGPEKLHKWIEQGNDGGSAAVQSFHDYLENQGIHVGDYFDHALTQGGSDLNPADYGQYDEWKDNLSPEAKQYFMDNPDDAEGDYYAFVDYDNGENWQYQSPLPGGPHLVNYYQMGVGDAPSTLTNKYGDTFSPGVGAFLLYQKDLDDDHDIDNIDSEYWEEIADDWENLPDEEKQKYIKIENSGQHPDSPIGKKLLMNDHQRMVSSPEFKAWFTKTNSGADPDDPSLAKMLFHEPDNTWTQQKVNGFKKYLTTKNDPDFQQFLKDQGYGPGFNLEDGYATDTKWNKEVANWEAENDKPAAFNAHNLIKSLRKIDPEFWDDHNVYMPMAKYSQDWHRKNLESLIAQGEKGDFPPPETAAYKKLYNKYFSEESGNEVRPEIIGSGATPRSLLDDEGSLIPEFQDWLWSKADTNLSLGQFLNTVEGWTPEHWKAAEQAFRSDTGQQGTDPAPPPVPAGPPPLDVDDILNELRQADPSWWDDSMVQNLKASGGANSPDWWKGYIEQFAQGNYPQHEMDIYQGLLDKYFPKGKWSQSSPYTTDFMVNEISKVWPTSGPSLQGLSEEEIKKKLTGWANPSDYSSKVNEKAKGFLDKYFGGGADSGAGPFSSTPGLGTTRDAPLINKPPTLEREIKKQLGTFIDKLRAPESKTIYSDEDIETARSADFQRWFMNAPEDYRKTVQKFPYIALDDFSNGGDYGWAPKSDDPAQVYKLFHAPEAQEAGGEIRHPSGETLQLPGDYKHNHWPGFTKNPKSKSRARPDVEFTPRPPNVPGQLEIPLGGGSSWEPEYKFPTLRRGIQVKFNRYKPGYDDHHLLSRPGEEGARHRAAADMLDEIRELMLGNEGVKKQDRTPTLFDDDDTELPEGMPRIEKNSDSSSWMDLFAWGQKNQLTPEQMWLMAKQGKIPNPDKWGVPPLSYLVEQSRRNPAPMARRIGDLIGDPDYASRNPDLANVAKTLKSIRDNDSYSRDYDAKIRMEAGHLYDKWFGQHFLDELLAHKILDYLETAGWKPSEYKSHPDAGGLGPHWTTRDKPQFGMDSPSDSGFPVDVEAEWPGLGEDPDRKDAAWDYPDEKEITKNPGTPVIVKKIRIQHPRHPRDKYDDHKWLELPLTPHIRHAALEPIPVSKPGRSVLSHRERFSSSALDDWFDPWSEYDHLVHPSDGGESSDKAGPKMTPEQMQQMQHRYDPQTDRFHFPPDKLNPPSDSPSRPNVRWQERDPEQPTLTDDAPRDRVPQSMFRGLAIDLNDPAAADLHRVVFGHHPDDDHLFDSATPHPKGKWDHPELAEAILNHLETPERGLGAHWSVDPRVAKEFALSEKWNATRGPDSKPLAVRLRSNWKGLGEDPYRSGTGEMFPGEHAQEDEITMLPGAGMPIHDVQIQHPETNEWISVLNTPQHRHAHVPVEVRPRSAKRIISQRELLEG